MTAALTPVYAWNGFDPAEWPGVTLEYVDADGLSLAAFPPSIGYRGPLGITDDLTYDRAPGSAVYRAYGDGIPVEPPRLTLSGAWRYRNTEEAIEHLAALEENHLLAHALHWRGQHLAFLRPGAPGSLLTSSGDGFTQISFSAVLNITQRLTRRQLREVQL